MAVNKDYIRRHKSWQKYAEKELAAGRKPAKFKNYHLKDVYLKGIKQPTSETELQKAGINWETDKPSARYKRKSK